MSDEIVKRMNYFPRQFLHATDFQDKQKYHVERHRRHNQYLHVSGVVTGLDVQRYVGVDGKPDDSKVTITAGRAIDPQGRDIVVVDALTPKLLDIIAPPPSLRWTSLR